MDDDPGGQGYVMAEPPGGDRVVADRYLLHEQVGRGGMGVVWRADDKVLKREVAVKEVNLRASLPDHEREALQERVLREARAAARIDHSGAVTVYDVAEDDGQAYIVMELVDAPTLSDVVEENGPLPTPEVARIGLAVLDVLAAAHASGIVHRDLKPGNVLVAGDSVKLTDFGIAQIKDDPRLTSTGIVLGSPSYISPEQARGEPVTPDTDLWGLGATLFYAACGRPPFDRGEPIATLTAVAHDDLVVDPCAGALAPVLHVMLDKEPERRPSVADLRAMLTAVANGDAPNVPPPAPKPAAGSEDTVAAAPVFTGAADVVKPATQPRRRGLRVFAAVLLLVTAAAAAAALAVRDHHPALSAADATFKTYTHPEMGWTAHYPAGWEIEARSATVVDFRDPASGRYLRVVFLPTPAEDLEKAWRSASMSFAGTHSGYDEILIDDATFHERPAAIWEYRWKDANVLHASSLAFTAGGRGYALNVQSREGDWERSQALFDQMRDLFEPAP